MGEEVEHGVPGCFLLPSVPVAKEVPKGFGIVPFTQPHCCISAKPCTQKVEKTLRGPFSAFTAPTLLHAVLLVNTYSQLCKCDKLDSLKCVRHKNKTCLIPTGHVKKKLRGFSHDE